MPRYIDVDELKRLSIKFGEEQCRPRFAELLCQYIDCMPTADVVPKSEVENYKQIAETQQKLSMDRYFEIKELKEDIERLKDDNKYLQDKVFKVQLEVARDIFEEIESKKTFLKDCVGNMGVVVLFKDISELKKKYTEEKK